MATPQDPRPMNMRSMKSYKSLENAVKERPERMRRSSLDSARGDDTAADEEVSEPGEMATPQDPRPMNMRSMKSYKSLENAVKERPERMRRSSLDSARGDDTAADEEVSESAQEMATSQDPRPMNMRSMNSYKSLENAVKERPERMRRS